MRGRLAATALAAFVAGFVVRGLFVEPRAPDAPSASALSAPRTPARREPRRVERDPEPVPPTQPPDVADEPAARADADAAAPAAKPSAAPTPSTLIVRGRCVDESGAPIAEVRVHLPDRSVACESGEDGRFEMTGVPLRAPAVNVFPDGRGFAARRVVLPAARDGVADLGDVALRRGGSISGRFVDIAGKPVAGAAVWLDSEEAGWLVVARTTTDADGRFVLGNVGDGTHVVSGRSPACTFDGGAQDAWVQGVTVGRRDVVLAVRSAHWVRLQFVDESGRPVGLFKGRASWTSLDDPSEGETSQWEGGGWAHGRIPVRPGATYEVRYECPGWLPVVQRVEGGDEYDKRVDVVFKTAPR